MEEYIINGIWQPKTKIPSENELRKTFKVSRNTVRSAIDKLKAIGVLVSMQGRGTFVNESVSNGFADGFMPKVFLDSEEIIEILEFRKTIEVEAAGFAAMRSNEQDIANIMQAYKDIMYSHLKEMNEMLGNTTGLEMHGKVVKAIKMKDSQMARLLMEKNLDITLSQMKQKLYSI